MVSEYFDEKNGWLISNWEGNVSLSEVVEYIRRTKTNSSYPRVLKILTRAEKAVINLSLKDLHAVSEENVLSCANYDVIIDAFIVDASVMTAISTMYQQVSQAKGYYFKVFSSMDAAIEWLEGF